MCTTLANALLCLLKCVLCYSGLVYVFVSLLLLYRWCWSVNERLTLDGWVTKRDGDKYFVSIVSNLSTESNLCVWWLLNTSSRNVLCHHVEKIQFSAGHFLCVLFFFLRWLFFFFFAIHPNVTFMVTTVRWSPKSLDFVLLQNFMPIHRVVEIFHSGPK